jgi:hypothetical protein
VGIRVNFPRAEPLNISLDEQATSEHGSRLTTRTASLVFEKSDPFGRRTVLNPPLGLCLSSAELPTSRATAAAASEIKAAAS